MKTACSIVAVLGLAVTFGPLSAEAQEALPAHEMLAPAWADVDKTIDGTLTPKQHVQLNDLAFSAAVDGLCEGFALDKRKFEAAFSLFTHEEDDSMTPEKLRISDSIYW